MSSMLLHPSFLHFIFLLLPLAFSSSLIASPNGPIAKPGCKDRCGNISIPFPFGVGSECSLDSSFNITCDTSADPPKALLSSDFNYTEVIEINTTQIRVKYPLLARICYSISGRHSTADSGTVIDLSGTQYTLSEVNLLTAIGCDDLMMGLAGGNKMFGGSCISYCEYRNDSDVVSCPDNVIGYPDGNGFCHIPIPRGTNSLKARFTDLSGSWLRAKLYPCSYAFIMEKGISDQSNFSCPSSYLKILMASKNDDSRVPFLNVLQKWEPTTVPPVVRLDWRINGAVNCKQAQLNSNTYACKDNSVCVDFDAKIGGYICKCEEGYEGNPYLTGGCQDIDECARMDNPCELICTNTAGSFKCSCPKGYYGDGRQDGSGCILHFQSKMVNVLIGLGSGFGFLLLLSMSFWLHKVLQKRKDKMRKEKFFKQNGGLILEQQTNEGTLGKTKLFLAKELEKATDHFNESRILGKGGQGTVYKGMLSDGKIVAIKKLKLVDDDQLKQFINEVMILSQINHRNVVKLLGCCLETEVPLLVYEFMPNGTLFDLIHDPNTEFPISWNMRLKIAADVAGALAYLHYACSIPIYHRDIKSSNILLDEKYIVKVSDFGTSRSVEADQTHLTTLVKGTFGYIDPEYFQSSQFTEKSDVYSFGVVLVELLTGQRPITFTRTGDDNRSLATRFLASMEEDNLDTILGPQVLEHGRKEEVIAVAKLARRCLNLNGKMRPTMKEVAAGLESYRISQMSSTVKDEFAEAGVYEAKPMMISDIEYTWTTSGNSIPSSSSDMHPLTFATM